MGAVVENFKLRSYCVNSKDAGHVVIVILQVSH